MVPGGVPCGPGVPRLGRPYPESQGVYYHAAPECKRSWLAGARPPRPREPWTPPPAEGAPLQDGGARLPTMLWESDVVTPATNHVRDRARSPLARVGAVRPARRVMVLRCASGSSSLAVEACSPRMADADPAHPAARRFALSLRGRRRSSCSSRVLLAVFYWFLSRIGGARPPDPRDACPDRSIPTTGSTSGSPTSSKRCASRRARRRCSCLTVPTVGHERLRLQRPARRRLHRRHRGRALAPVAPAARGRRRPRVRPRAVGRLRHGDQRLPAVRRVHVDSATASTSAIDRRDDARAACRCCSRAVLLASCRRRRR